MQIRCCKCNKRLALYDKEKNLFVRMESSKGSGKSRTTDYWIDTAFISCCNFLYAYNYNNWKMTATSMVSFDPPVKPTPTPVRTIREGVFFDKKLA